MDSTEKKLLSVNDVIQKFSLGTGIVLVILWGAFDLSDTVLGIGMALISLPVFLFAANFEARLEAEKGPQDVDSM